tara:strand:+ start:1733 stop:2719 length:987 start_codon:yes stop_codon:yes gene_type:complete
MGLKDLKSTLDLIAENDPVGNMDSQSGPKFQLPTEVASQKHVDSLQQVPGGTSNSPFQDLNGVPDPNFNTLEGTSDSPFQSETGDHMVDLLTQNAVSTNTGNTYDPSIKDLNGEPGPQSQLSIPDASQAHIDSLQQVPGGASNSPHQDLNIDVVNETPLPFQRPLGVADQAHQDSLQQVPGGTSNSPFQDLNGEPDPLFNTLEGTSDSPFVPRGGTGDHMVDLLNSTVASTNTGQTYERSNQDLNITENGIGNITYFHGVANPGALDGLQLNGADLHEALLTDSYNYSYGITQGNYQANVEISQGGFDLDGGLPTNGKYTNPDTGVGF